MKSTTRQQKEPERRGPAAIDPRMQRRLERLWDQAYAAETQDDLRGLFAECSESYDEDHAALGVRSQIEMLQDAGAWRLLDVSPPEPYLPKKDHTDRFGVWCFEVLGGKRREPSESSVSAARAALLDPDPAKRLDHAQIWDQVASRLDGDYIRTVAYYLTACELEILGLHAEEIVTESPTFFAVTELVRDDAPVV